MDRRLIQAAFVHCCYRSPDLAIYVQNIANRHIAIQTAITNRQGWRRLYFQSKNMEDQARNWAGNLRYGASTSQCPQSLPELQALVAKSDKIKAVGTRHSFNPIADTSGVHANLGGLNEIDLSSAEQTVRIKGQVRYGELGKILHSKGFALPNLASLPHISVVGACATATHGSGVKNGILATSACGLEMVVADGTLVKLTESDDDFFGAIVGLGALGIVTEMTLRVVPTFQIEQYVFEDLAFESLESNFEQVVSSAYSVSLFTKWSGDNVSQVWLKKLAGEKPIESFYGATAAPDHRHPIRDISPENCTRQMGIPGTWHERLPHFRLEYTPSAGEELQSEYLVPLPHGRDAIRALRALGNLIDPLLLISEIRCVASDSLWMSPCFGQSCLGLHFTWRKDWEAVSQLLPIIERALESFGAKPHWGKLFAMDAKKLQPLFPMMGEFQRLQSQFDPKGKFRNPFLDSILD